MSTRKCSIYFWLLYPDTKFIVQHILQSSSNILFRCHNNSFLNNDAPLFKLVAFNVALLNIALSDLELLDAALFEVELF